MGQTNRGWPYKPALIPRQYSERLNCRHTPRMPLSGHVIGWLVLLPLSTISMGAVILALTLQRSLLRSVDVFMLSILISLFLQVSVCVGVQIHVHVQDGIITHALCTIYIWTSFTMRASQIFSLTSLSLERTVIFRSPAKCSYRSSHTVSLVVVSVWLLSMLFGAIPVAGFSGLKTMAARSKRCNFLPDGIHFGLALVVVILDMTLMLISTILLLDTLVQWRHIRNKALFTLHPSVHDVTKGTLSDVRSGADIRNWPHDVAAAYGSCRFVCIAAAVLLLCNHLPYTVLVFTGVVTTDIPADTRRTIVVWCLAVAGFLLPNCLWICNARYRAAYRHMLARIMCVDKNGPRMVHLESYRKQTTRDRGRGRRLLGEHSQLCSPTLDVTSPTTTSSVSMTSPSTSSSISTASSIHYVNDIWRPERTSDIAKTAKNKQRKRKARLGAAIIQGNDHILSEQGAAVGDPETETRQQTGSREPPDGSSHCSLKDCVPRTQGSPRMALMLDVEALDETEGNKGCTQGTGHINVSMSQGRNIKYDSYFQPLNGNVAARQESKSPLQYKPDTENHDNIPNSDLKDLQINSGREQNQKASRASQLHGMLNICAEIKTLRQKHSQCHHTSTDALILPSSVESLPVAAEDRPNRRCKPALHSRHSTSSDSTFEKGARKRHQWLRRMRQQWLPAAFIETLNSDGSDVNNSGFVRMRYRNFRSRFRGRAENDWDTMEYVRKCLQSGSPQMVAMYGFKNYKNTVDRKESIVFRRRRRASVPLESHSE